MGMPLSTTRGDELPAVFLGGHEGGYTGGQSTG